MNSIPDDLQDILTAHPEYISGAVRFVDTRMPLWVLLDYVETGTSIEEFFLDYPNVPRESVERVLAWIANQSRLQLGVASK